MKALYDRLPPRHQERAIKYLHMPRKKRKRIPITGSESANMALAPTGCAASHIGGSTVYRALNIPVGRKMRKQPTNMVITDVNKMLGLTASICKLELLTIDEHSMIGRGLWAWILHLPPSNSRTAPGLELVGASRVDHPDCIAIGNKLSDLSKNQLFKIGQTPAYQARRDFQASLQQISDTSMERVRNDIKELDTSVSKTFDGGCKFLLEWYRTTYPLPPAVN